MGLTDIASGLTGRFSGDDGGDDEGGSDEIVGELGEDDDFGDLDGWEDEDDDLDDLGGDDGGATADLEPRIDELEKEVENISSTMGTVRSENEAISETVEEMEDNIRKLLEIYEMVTRGVNPFVDEAEGAASSGDSFGLFGDEEEVESDDDGLDPEVAEADADSFFDDDWEDDEPNDEEPGDADEEESSTGEDGKTFDDLKSEYEEGQEELDEGPADEERQEEFDEITAEGDGGEPDGFGFESEADGDATGTHSGPSDNGDGKPYLDELPGGYGADLLVIEWLSYLRGCSSTPEALRAIRYYETIGWIGGDAADALSQYLTGLSENGGVPMPGQTTQLTVEHHTTSLGFIGRLSGADVQVERLDWSGPAGPDPHSEGGKQRGIQR